MAKTKSEIERAIDRTPATNDWQKIKTLWKQHLTDYEDIGKPPVTSVQFILEKDASSIQFQSTEKEILIGFDDNIRQLMLREAIFLGHKSLALLRTVDRDINSNHATNAEITSYISSFLLAKAILIILGVWLPEKKINNKYLIIDAFPAERVNTNKIKLINSGTRQIGHQDVWGALQRVMRVIKNSPMEPQFYQIIAEIDKNSFAELRNDFQYKNLIWFYEDLHVKDNYLFEDMNLNPFCDDILDIVPNLDEKRSSHFGISLYLLTYRAYNSLLNDLKESNLSIQEEQTLMFENINNGCLKVNI